MQEMYVWNDNINPTKRKAGKHNSTNIIAKAKTLPSWAIIEIHIDIVTMIAAKRLTKKE